MKQKFKLLIIKLSIFDYNIKLKTCILLKIYWKSFGLSSNVLNHQIYFLNN